MKNKNLFTPLSIYQTFLSLTMLSGCKTTQLVTRRCLAGINSGAIQADWFYSIDFYDKSSKIGIERCTRSEADRLTVQAFARSVCETGRAIFLLAFLIPSAEKVAEYLVDKPDNS